MSRLIDETKLMLLTDETIESVSAEVCYAGHSPLPGNCSNVQYIYGNYTNHDITVVEKSGLRIRVQPEERVPSKYAGLFLIEEKINTQNYLISPPRSCSYESDGKRYDITKPYQQFTKLLIKDNDMCDSIIHTVTNEILEDSRTGVYVPLVGVTVGRTGKEIRNKYLDNYLADREIGCSIDFSLKLISKNATLRLYVVIGNTIEELLPIDKGIEDERIEVYGTNKRDTMELRETVCVTEAIDREISGFRVFRNKLDARAYITDHVNAIEVNAKLNNEKDMAGKDLVKAKEEISALKLKVAKADSKAETERTKATVGFWSKAATIIAGTASIIASIWGIVKLIK